MARKPTIYDHIEFPPYEFREFPKHVVNAQGQSVVVENAEEEVLVGIGAEARPDPVAQAKKMAELEAEIAALRAAAASQPSLIADLTPVPEPAPPPPPPEIANAGLSPLTLAAVKKAKG